MSRQPLRVMRSMARWLLVVAAIATSPLTAQPALPPATATPEDASTLEVAVMTMGPGEQVWERFGHNALWLRDRRTGLDVAYNYGLFDFNEADFIPRFLRGRMWYWMAGFPALPYAELYARQRRAVWVQELDLDAPARGALREFLEWNARPENRFYGYDYYRDNCSTRVRDALDRVLGGALGRHLRGAATGTTFRWHTQRLTAPSLPVYVGTSLALGHPVDRPIDAWEESFLPMALMRHLRTVRVRDAAGERPLVRREYALYAETDYPESAAPPRWRWRFLAAGLAAAGAIVLLMRRAASRGGSRALAGLAGAWYLLAGLAGTVLALLWAVTHHTAAYANENLLLCAPLALPLAFLAPRPLVGRRTGKGTRLLTLAVAAAATCALLLKALPAFRQDNWDLLALAVPVHLALAAAVLRMRPSA